MKINLFMTADAASGQIDKSQAAIVIDVLRASSVISTAIHNGAEKIRAFLTIEETLKYKEENRAEDILLCGERNRVLIDGFDLSNSPGEYTKDRVKGKTLAMTTTNGTKAIEYSKDAGLLYIMSFLNLKAVCDDLAEGIETLSFVCAGTEGKFSLDDFACAGKAIRRLSMTHQLELDDGAYLAKEYFEQNDGDIRAMLSESVSYKGVIAAGFDADIDYCLKKNIFDSIPIYKNGFIKAKPRG